MGMRYFYFLTNAQDESLQKGVQSPAKRVCVRIAASASAIYTLPVFGGLVRNSKPSFIVIRLFALLLATQLISAAQTPVLSLDHAGPVDFGGSPVGGTGSIPGGADRNFHVSNTGSALLTITNIQFTGPFGIPISIFPPFPIDLSAGSATNILVEFGPQTAGPQSGSMIITDNAPGSPHIVQLSGTGLGGSEFTFVPEFSSPSATVTAGQSASYTLELASGPTFSGAVTIGCQGLPPGTSLFVFPLDRGNVFGLPPHTVDPLSVQINTRAVAVASNRVPGLWFGTAMGLGLLLVSRRKITAAAALTGCLMFLAVSSFTACGGSHIADQKTPPGTYNVTFTATSGSVTKSVPATLIVQ